MTMTNQTETHYAEQQAQAQVAAIVAAIVAAMTAYNCDYDRLEELRDERATWLEENPGRFLEPNDPRDGGRWYLAHPDEAEELDELRLQAGEYESQEDAEEAINEMPLSIEVRSAWTTLDEGKLTPAEYRIVLCTGGPHVELVGDLDSHNEPERVRVLYKDWDCHGELFDFDRDTVLQFAQFFQYSIE